MANAVVTERVVKPFGHRVGLPGRDFFYGRAKDLMSIADMIAQGQPVALLGLRGIGKTSLLQYLANEYRHRPEWGLGASTTLVPIDLGNFRLRGDQLLSFMANEAARMCGVEPPRMEEENAREWLREQKKSGRHFLFLLDEFEAIAKVPAIQPRHLMHLRALYLELGLVYVIASHRSIYDLSLSERIKSSEFFNIFYQRYLGVFSHEEAREMIWGRDGERQTLFTEADLARMYALTAWHPLVLSLTCARVYELRTGGQPVHWDEIEDDILQETRYEYRYFWERDLNDGNRNLLRRVHTAQGAERHELWTEYARELRRLANMGLLLLDESRMELVPGLSLILKTESKQSAARGLRHEELIEKLEHIDGKLENILVSGPALDKYNGYVCAMITDEHGEPLPSNEQGGTLVVAEQSGRLVVWFASERPETKITEAINISDGRKADDVLFELAIDSDTVQFTREEQPLSVCPGEDSGRCFFDFQAPATPGEHQFWLQVLQKNRLIQVVHIYLQVGPKGD